MAKTILAPFTHARNFLSAGAFAAANGIIPFGDMQAVRQSFEALQIGTRTKAGNELYQKLLKLGVVNSQVQLGDLQRLLNVTPEKWIKKNKWFGVDRKLTMKAFKVHELIVSKLKVNSGSKLYFLLVDLFMKKYLDKDKKWKK